MNKSAPSRRCRVEPLTLVVAWLMVLLAALTGVFWVYQIVTHAVAPREALDAILKTPAAHLTFLACALACAALITGREWAAKLVRISAMWNVGLLLPHIPLVTHNILPVFFSVFADPYTEGVTGSLILALIGHAALFVALIITASKGIQRQEIACAEAERRAEKPGARYGTYLIIAGLIGVASGLIIAGVGPELVGYRARAGGRALFIGAAVLTMAGQCVFRLSFRATSAVTLSALLLPFDPAGSTVVRTIEIWAVPLALGLAAQSCTRTPKWMRIAAICLPALLLVIELTMPWVTPPNLGDLAAVVPGR